MSELNLIPDSCIVAVQAGIFMANAFVVKKLLLDPFLAVRDKRAGLTTSAKKSADLSQEESARKESEIESQLAHAHTQAQQHYKETKQKAIHAHQEIVDEATKTSAAKLNALHVDIQQAYDGEKQKIEATATELVEELYPVVVG